VSLGLEKVAYIELSVTYFADTASGGIWRVLSAVVYSSGKSSGFYYTYFAHRTTTEFTITHKFTAFKFCFTAYTHTIRHQVFFFGARMGKCKDVIVIVKLILLLAYSKEPGIFH
jgi:hypothetical protein